MTTTPDTAHRDYCNSVEIARFRRLTEGKRPFATALRTPIGPGLLFSVHGFPFTLEVVRDTRPGQPAGWWASLHHR